VDEGTPQGGPLSPLLSNLVLDELDRELERRGHRFVRYADDCNVYVGSERAGQRVMESGTSRMNREIHVRLCERLGAKFPGPTRRRRGDPSPYADWESNTRGVQAGPAPLLFKTPSCRPQMVRM
jgi:hypothetical protein